MEHLSQEKQILPLEQNNTHLRFEKKSDAAEKSHARGNEKQVIFFIWP